MSPTAKTLTAQQPPVNNAPNPAPAASMVGNIPMHNPGQPQPIRNEDAELDKIMQDVGHELRKDDSPRQKHHFWELKPHHKKEANFSTQKSIHGAPHPAAGPKLPQPAPHPAPAASKSQTMKAPVPHTRVKPVAQTLAKAPKSPKPPKQRHLPVMVTCLTVLVTAALIAAAYYAYK